MFLAHTNSIPENSYHPLLQYQNKKVLVNDGDFRIVSNVCPHQKSIISKDAGTGNRVCPYHSWSFSVSGVPITSGRTGHYCINDKPLEKFPAYQWNSLLFSSPVDLDIPADFSTMELVEQRVDVVKSRFENILDLFLDVDHIAGIHAGVYDRIDLPDIRDVKWKYYKNGSVQLVSKGDSIGAAWITLYPNTMIEWQPGALFITVANKKSLFETEVSVFKYRDTETTDSLWQLNEDVWETAWQQDKDQAEIITEFNQENLEESKIHFRNWLKYGIN